MAAPAPLLLVGFGDIAARVARLVENDARAIRTLSRRLPAPPLEGGQLDLDRPNPRLPLSVAGASLLVTVPPTPSGNHDRRSQRLIDAIEARTRRGEAPPARVVYISTTGVYGDCGGDWVDESRPPEPSSPRGRRRLSAERQWARACARWGTGLAVLRVPGIFACERLRPPPPLVVCPDEAPWSNRVHAEDLAAVCLRLSDPAAPAGIFNIADDTPSSMTDHAWQVADFLGLPRPPCASLEAVMARASPMGREFLAESKRIRNDRLKQALDWRPRWPSLAEALADCARSGKPLTSG